MDFFGELKKYKSLKHVSLTCVYYQSKKISEQPCSNGEPEGHTVLWEDIQTVHKLILGCVYYNG
jgi:hypothetical protein